MTLKAIARRYAAAAIDVARRNQRVDRVGRDLDDFKALLAANAELASVLTTPAIAPQKKHAILEALLAASGDVSEEARRLLLMLAERDRLALAGDIADLFREAVLAESRVIRAEVVTAVPLGDDARAALGRALGAVTKSDVTITERVDPSIVGGVIATVGSRVFDGSVVRQLERMKQQLVADA